MAANTTLATLRADLAARLARLRPRACRRPAQFVRRLGIKTAVARDARWATSRAATSRRWPWRAGWRPSPRVLILDEPTQGVDVGAKAEIHRLMSELAGDGPGHPDDLVRAARDPRHERPDRRDARRHDRRPIWTAPARPRRRSSSWRLGTCRTARVRGVASGEGAVTRMIATVSPRALGGRGVCRLAPASWRWPPRGSSGPTSSGPSW